MQLKRLRYGIEAAAARGVLGLLDRMDLRSASDLGGRLGRLLGPRLARRQALARDNMARALPGVDVEALLPEMWDNLGRTFFEFSKIRTIEKARGAEVVEMVGADVIRQALAGGRGMVLFSGHIANWEVLALPPALVDFDAAMMYRAPNNQAVHRLLNGLRPARVSFLEKNRQGTLEAFATLKAGRCVGFLIDHRYSKGVEVRFFGRRAFVAPTAALMARKFGCPLVPLRVERLEDGPRFRVTAYPPLAVDYALPSEEFGRTVMQTCMSTLESWIRERPAHWFWVQRLWTD